MDTIKIVIETEQSCSMTYHLTCYELAKLKQLIENKGNAVIAGSSLTARGEYLVQFKEGGFTGANYAMPIEGVLEKIESKILQYC